MRSVIILFCSLLFIFSGFQLNAQIEFQIAPVEIYTGQLLSQKDMVVDMNGDYLDDIVLIVSEGIYVYYQNPNNTFTEKYFHLAPEFLNAQWNALGSDFNNDGKMDIVIGNNEELKMLLSTEFQETFEVKKLPENYFVQRTSAIDLDLDGDLDIFSCNDNAINQVYENIGDGEMVANISMLPTVDLAGNYSHIWSDYDNDGDQDLQISKCYVATTNVNDPERINLFYRNNGDGTYTEVGAEINMNDNAQSWVCNMEDFDNDGDFDAFISNHDFANRFMLNNGDGTFTDVIDSTGIDSTDIGSLESYAYDFDNNGFVDLISDSKRKMWLNNGNLSFTDVITPMNMWFNGGMGDLNNDGFIDMIVGNNVWFNQGNENNWVKISTKGLESNPNGIGARVEIYGDWGMQSREVRAGHSFSTMSTLNTHFGIGTSINIDSIVVKWPSGLRSTKVNPTINSFHLIHEYECISTNIALSANSYISFCEGEQISLQVPNGYSNIEWSTGSTDANIVIDETGFYFATMQDAQGCFVQSDPIYVELIQEAIPTIFPNGEITICNGDTITLTASVVQEDFNWNNGTSNQSLEVSETGFFFVETTGVCSNEPVFSDTVMVSIFQVPVPIVTDVQIQGGTSVTLFAEGENVVWFNSAEGGNVIGAGNEFTTPFLSMDVTYYAANILSTENGDICSSERVPVNVTISNTAETFRELGITIFPNPAIDNLNINIEFISEVIEINFMDQGGKQIKSIKNVSSNQMIDLRDIIPGLYNIQFNTTKGIISKPIVVEH